MEESPAYWAAMILHPRHKRKWVDRFLGEERSLKAYRAYRDFYLAEYAVVALPVPASPAQPPRTGPGAILVTHNYYDPPDDPNRKDEPAEYLTEGVRPVDDIKSWWFGR